MVADIVKDFSLPVNESEKNTTSEDIKNEVRLHKSFIDDYLIYTKYQESPAIFHKWVAISILANALNRNVYLQLGYKRIYPNLYVVLVSPTGVSSKTTAANIGINDFLQKLETVRILRDETTAKGLVEYLALAQPIVSTTSTGSTKVVHNCHTLFYATELADCIGDQSYNSGLVKKLTALWDCPDTYDDNTKEILKRDKKPLRLTNVCMNFFGCSNPEWLAHGIKEDAFGGGFAGRTIFVYSEETRRFRESAWMKIPPEIKSYGVTLLCDLQKITKLSGAFDVHPDAETYFEDLYLGYKGECSGRMVGYAQRKIKTYVLKMAMILAINESSKMLLRREHIDMALDTLVEVEKDMPRAFVYINATNEAKIAQHIIENITDNNGAQYRDVLLGAFRHLIKNIREFDDIMQMLVEAKILKMVRKDERLIYVLYAIYEKQVREKNEEILKEQLRLQKEQESLLAQKPLEVEEKQATIQ